MSDEEYMESVMSMWAQSSALRRLALYPPIKSTEWGITTDYDAYYRMRSEILSKPRPSAAMYKDIFPPVIDIPCEVIEDKQLPENTETPKP